MKKNILCLILVMVLSLNMSLPAVAANVTLGGKTEITGYSEDEMAIPNSKIVLSNTMGGSSNSSLSISIESLSRNSISDVEIEGNFYPFPSGAYAGKVIVGQFTSSNNDLDVQTVKLSAIDNENNPVLDIKIKDKLSDNIYSTSGQITQEKYDEIYASAMNNYNQFLQENDYDTMAYKDFLVSIALGDDFATPITSEADESSSLEASVLSQQSTMSSLSDIPYVDLKSFVRALKNNNTIFLSSYDISPEFLTTTGFDHVVDKELYAASKYTHVDPNGIYYTRLTIADLIEGVDTSNKEIHYQIQYTYGVMIEYVDGAPTATLYLDNYGLKFKNVCLKIDKLGNSTSNFFKSWEMSGSVSNSSLDVVTLIGLVPKLSIIATAWSAFQVYHTESFNGGIVYFDDTIDKQIERWGKVIRGIAFDSDDVYIGLEGQRMTLRGGYNAVGTLSYEYGCKYTAST